MRDYLRENGLGIVDFYIKNEVIEVLTSSGVITSKDYPELEEMSLKALKELKDEFVYNTGILEKVIVDAVVEVRNNVNLSIQNLIQSIAQVRYKSTDVLSKKITEALEGIDIDVRNEIYDILKDKRGLHKELAKIVGANYTDVLTSCSNGNFFQRFLGKEDLNFNRHTDLDEFNLYLKMLNENMTDSVMFCDMNNFKAINDLVSHEAGDRVLKNFAEEVYAIVGEDVNVIRYGGDEFVLLGSKEVLEDLENVMNSKSFISKVNSHIPPEIELFGQPLVSTISKGISEVYIPAFAYCKDDIIDFKKKFSKNYHKAEELSKVDKIKIKEEMGVGEYRSIGSSKETIKYQVHRSEQEGLDTSERKITVLQETWSGLGIK